MKTEKAIERALSVSYKAGQEVLIKKIQIRIERGEDPAEIIKDLKPIEWKENEIEVTRPVKKKYTIEGYRLGKFAIEYDFERLRELRRITGIKYGGAFRYYYLNDCSDEKPVDIPVIPISWVEIELQENQFTK